MPQQPAPSPTPANTALWPVLPALALGALTTCRPFLASGLDLAPGDLGDARIMVFLLESSWRALLGGHSPLSPPMFAPVTGTLGYTDAHLLWLAPYGVLRLLGLDEVRAFTGMVVAVLGWGCLSCWWLWRRALGLDSRAAAVGAYLFAFGNPMQMKLNHAQMIAVCLLPSVLLLLHAAWRRQRAWPALAAGLLTGLLFATSYVPTWFFLFFALLTGLIGVVLAPLRLLRDPALWRLLAGFGLGFAIGLVPFAAIYGDLILYGPRRDPGSTNFYRPRLSDLFNLGAGHPVWGRLLAWFGVPGGDPASLVEREMGSSPPVWALAVAGGVLLWRQQGSPERRILLLAALGAALGTLLEFRYGRGLWPWMLVYLEVPGAAAIRNPFRSELVALLAYTGLAAVALEALLRRRRLVSAAVLAGLAMVGSAFHLPPAQWRASSEEARLAAAPPPPAGCAVFALAPQAPGGEPAWVLQSDALMLALHWRRPTINGNSSVTPPGWHLGDPAAPDYAAALAAWVATHHLAGRACFYDAAGRAWLKGG